ncbi:hypothetical protein H6P81_015513 [Aristolochia fimbriata]|uniref:Dirigent protein n=1 Tax=Aristolochia fimbriata TaxID=158543 RepID=A0AAV7E5T0_ARIFI|nr:hypothetical protein H6P81_015513 [Aristolochia fimbriata]
MGRSSFLAVLFLLLSYLLCKPSVIADAGKLHSRTKLSKRVLLHGFRGRAQNHEKLTHLHFYFHDIVTGRNPSSMPIISNKTASGFGSAFMIDDPLTEGPEPSSELIGRAQGVYAMASQQDAGLLMLMNFVFVSGKYNGSSLSVMGRNAVFSEVREMPVIGGAGLFRWARGYAQATTVWFNPDTGNAVVEYHVHVLHY